MLRRSPTSAGLFLADRAEEGGASVLHDAAHGAVAARRRAGLTLAVVDPEMMLEIAEIAVGAAVIAQRRTAGLDGVVEHGLDGIDESVGARIGGAAARRDGRGLAARRQPRPVQRLACIDIADTGDDFLVDERGLEARLLAGAGGRQHARVERIAERFGTDLAHQRMG